MFMTADEIKSRVSSSIDQGYSETMPQLWDRKWEHSAHTYDRYEDPDEEGHYKGIGPSLRESIVKEGFQQKHPLTILHTDLDEATLPDAHHRVAVMSKLHPDQFINVEHHTSMFNLTSSGVWNRDFHEKERRKAHQQRKQAP